MKRPTSKQKQNSIICADIEDALDTIDDFIHQVTGQAPTQQEIARALKRYFVLNEIKAHILMERSKN